jgi:serine phosphatase RsbU (regulator of sigma subunit)
MKHMFINEINGIIQAMQTCLQRKEYRMKHKGYHPKEAILVKPSHLDHSFDKVTKFKQTKGHELGVKKTREKKPQEEVTQPQNV